MLLLLDACNKLLSLPATRWLTVERKVYNAPLELAGVIINMPLLEWTVGYVKCRVLAGVPNVRPN